MKHAIPPATALVLFAAALALAPLPLTAQPSGADDADKAFTFHEIRDGVYHAVGTGALAVGCNGA
ncbi:MAG TPA: hypothetical protein VGG06_11455 [Thermoanaerobaculia bacterium]|jgi:hypothetical protein